MGPPNEPPNVLRITFPGVLGKPLLNSASLLNQSFAAVTVGRTLYLHTPDGYGNSDLAAATLRIVSSPKAGVTGTARNWATMTKLHELSDNSVMS